MKESTALWWFIGQLLIVLALIAVGFMASARLACLLVGCLAAIQFVQCVNTGIVTFVPFFRTTIDERRHPKLFLIAAASHAIVTAGLVAFPILSWFDVFRVSSFQ